jgi:hypothetical protein
MGRPQPESTGSLQLRQHHNQLDQMAIFVDFDEIRKADKDRLLDLEYPI